MRFAYADPPYLGCCRLYSHHHPDGRCWDDVATHPFHAFKKGVRPAFAWEPVIFRGGRNAKHPPPEKRGAQTTPRDWVSCNITLRRGLTGAKPEPVCEWLLDLLNVQAGDEVVDLYPGSGVMQPIALARTTGVA